MRNIEIKAKVEDLALILNRAKKLSGREATIIQQEDTFYNANKGRLKLRRLLAQNCGELIFYDRPDTEGPKISSFEKLGISNSEDVNSLNSILTKALGSSKKVKKKRHLFLVDQTRIHVDEVENLGNFMELEVCLKADQSAEEGEKIAHALMTELGIEESDLISGAYADLLPNS